MTCVMCCPWKRTFTLVPLAPLTMFSHSGNFLVISINPHVQLITFNLIHIKSLKLMTTTLSMINKLKGDILCYMLFSLH
jgi:hypothetical protein